MIQFSASAVNDCYRTSIACFLEINPINLSNYAEEDDKQEHMSLTAVNKELKRYDAVAVVVSFEESFGEVIDFMVENFGPDYTYILSGNTSDDQGHCWIFKGEEIFHNVTPATGDWIRPFKNSEGITYQVTHVLKLC